jgi:hypothetical protein
VRQETSSVSPLSNSSPVPLGSRGFSLESSESPLLCVLGSLATALRYLHLQDFREGGTTRASGLLILHDLDVVPVAGSSQVTQSECPLSQLRNLARLSPARLLSGLHVVVHLQIVEADGQLTRRYVASVPHCSAMWIELIETYGAGGTDQAARC